MARGGKWSKSTPAPEQTARWTTIREALSDALDDLDTWLALSAADRLSTSGREDHARIAYRIEQIMDL